VLQLVPVLASACMICVVHRKRNYCVYPQLSGHSKYIAADCFMMSLRFTMQARDPTLHRGSSHQRTKTCCTFKAVQQAQAIQDCLRNAGKTAEGYAKIREWRDRLHKMN
jgi:hypothetical protein